MEEDRLVDAADKAVQLARLVDDAGDEARPRSLARIGEALLSTGQIEEAHRYFIKALKNEIANVRQSLGGRTDLSLANSLSLAMAPMMTGLAGVAATGERPKMHDGYSSALSW